MEPTSSLAWADVIHADFQTVISRYLQNINTQTIKLGMFSFQNRRGLNQPILRPLWWMTSAAADVISVPSVSQVIFEYGRCSQLRHVWSDHLWKLSAIFHPMISTICNQGLPIFSCGKQLHKHLCLSVHLSVHPSLSEHISPPITMY